MSAPGEQLAPEWRRWLVENLLRGTAEEDLVGVLERSGVDAELARAAVRAELEDPYLHGALKALGMRRKLEGLLDLYGDLYRQAEGHARVDRHDALPPEDFFERYYFQNRPVVVLRARPTDYVRGGEGEGPPSSEAPGTQVPPGPARKNLLLCQLQGRRRFQLIPAFELHHIAGPEPEAASRLEVELGPGELLLVPVGWWYGYRVEEASAATAFDAFATAEPNVTWAPEGVEPEPTPPPRAPSVSSGPTPRGPAPSSR